MIEDGLLDIPSVKINDFNTSVEFKPKDKKARKMRKMTFYCLYFIPPEVVANIGYNERSDIWSIGLLLLSLLTGKIPTKGSNNAQTLKNIKSKEINIKKMVKDGELDEDVGNLLSKMIERDPEKRISPVEAINHPWVIKYSKSEGVEVSTNQVMKDNFREFWNHYFLQHL